MQTLHNSTKTHTLAGNLIQKKLPDRSNCRIHLIHTDIARQKMLGGYLEIYVAVIMIKISSCIHSILTGNNFIIRRENKYLFDNMSCMFHGNRSPRFLTTSNHTDSIYHHHRRNVQNVHNHQSRYRSPRILPRSRHYCNCIHYTGQYYTGHYLRRNFPLLVEHNHLQDK